MLRRNNLCKNIRIFLPHQKRKSFDQACVKTPEPAPCFFLFKSQVYQTSVSQLLCCCILKNFKISQRNRTYLMYVFCDTYKQEKYKFLYGCICKYCTHNRVVVHHSNTTEEKTLFFCNKDNIFIMFIGMCFYTKRAKKKYLDIC